VLQKFIQARNTFPPFAIIVYKTSARRLFATKAKEVYEKNIIHSILYHLTKFDSSWRVNFPSSLNMYFSLDSFIVSYWFDANAKQHCRWNLSTYSYAGKIKAYKIEKNERTKKDEGKINNSDEQRELKRKRTREGE